MSRNVRNAGRRRAGKPRRSGHKTTRRGRGHVLSPTTHVIAAQQLGGWTYALVVRATRGYPASASVGRTRTAADRLHVFGLQDEFRAFCADADGVKKARAAYRKIVGADSPAQAWTTIYNNGDV